MVTTAVSLCDLHPRICVHSLTSRWHVGLVPINPLGAVIEIPNLSVCAMPVINCVQADGNEPFAFLGAHCRFRAHEGGPPLVSRFFLITLDRIECEPVLWDLPR